MLPPNHLEESHRGYRHPFIFGTIFFGGLPDLAMSLCSAYLRRRPEWWTRFRDTEELHLWYAEIAERRWEVRGPSSMFKIQLSPKQAQYVMDELDGYAGLRDVDNECQVSCFERIWESSSLFTPEYTTSFLSELQRLREDFPPRRGEKDNIEQVLVDPLLHSLVYHRTLVRWSPSRAPRTLPPPVSNDIYTISLDFAALPSDVSVSPSGSAKFQSYINNINPDTHKSIYAHLETLLSKSVPLFEHTLTDLHRNNPLVQRIRGTCKYSVWEEPDAPEHSDDEEGWARYERKMREWVMNRPIMLPDVPAEGYLPGTLERRRFKVNLKGRKVQVFTRVSEIKLTPGGPEYLGSEWGVEGMRSERIVACNFHYVQCQNVVPSALEFRMAVSYPRGFIAGDTGATLRTWGLTDGDGCQQYIGALPISEGLSVTFPNIYQTRMTPFKLLDPSKAGSVTIVAFLLVDPDIRPVVSTASVPPQQEKWVHGAVYEALRTRLPVELVEVVLEHLGRAFVGALERFTQASNNYHFCIPFDVWNGPDSVA
ncbi:hypothetical protein DFP72DRAFT_900008 [Ephemerocybe angulata]|uniref:DUF4246 domain-containing protein n=1 Tax=Ephemerocybe angulata TaxID=980116 RepID=A0A8H6HXJ3_9AGAR|nr:hypothetical protein DFP72DRAFT_900008 [Tulosesus angulatus]